MMIRAVFGASFLLLAISFGLFYSHLAQVSNFFIVHFDSLFGLTFLGGRLDVLEILITGLVINLTNSVLAWALYSRDKFFAALLSFFTLFFSLLILIAMGVIITIN